MRAVIEQTWGWDEGLQRTYFDRRFEALSISIIECDGNSVGAVMLEWKPDDLYIHELQLLPSHQGHGIGSAVIQKLIEQAAHRGLPVTLSVVVANSRAKQLYKRLGFEVIDFQAPFFLMRRNQD